MTGTPLQLAVIVGSTREGRFGSTVAEWFVTEARKRDDMALDVIDLVDVDLPMVYPQLPEPGVKAYIERIDRADAFVVITPEYNHGYPAALKQAIDLPHTQWRRKPVAFVSYGGVGGGLRAVEQLRQVFAELHAVTMRDSVSFHMAWDRFDESGEAREAAGCNAAAETMLDDLAWWATALRNARTADDARLAKGVSTDALEVVVLGRLPEVMERATSVLESHGFSASGVFSEEDVRLAIAEHDDLVAVVTGGAIDRPAQDRLRAAATAKGVALIPASMADGEVLFAKDVIPKLVEARDGPEREG